MSSGGSCGDGSCGGSCGSGGGSSGGSSGGGSIGGNSVCSRGEEVYYTSGFADNTGPRGRTRRKRNYRSHGVMVGGASTGVFAGGGAIVVFFVCIGVIFLIMVFFLIGPVIFIAGISTVAVPNNRQEKVNSFNELISEWTEEIRPEMAKISKEANPLFHIGSDGGSSFVKAIDSDVRMTEIRSSYDDPEITSWESLYYRRDFLYDNEGKDLSSNITTIKFDLYGNTSTSKMIRFMVKHEYLYSDYTIYYIAKTICVKYDSIQRVFGKGCFEPYEFSSGVKESTGFVDYIKMTRMTPPILSIYKIKAEIREVNDPEMNIPDLGTSFLAQLVSGLSLIFVGLGFCLVPLLPICIVVLVLLLVVTLLGGASGICCCCGAAGGANSMRGKMKVAPGSNMVVEENDPQEKTKSDFELRDFNVEEIMGENVVVNEEQTTTQPVQVQNFIPQQQQFNTIQVPVMNNQQFVPQNQMQQNMQFQRQYQMQTNQGMVMMNPSRQFMMNQTGVNMQMQQPVTGMSNSQVSGVQSVANQNQNNQSTTGPVIYNTGMNSMNTGNSQAQQTFVQLEGTEMKEEEEKKPVNFLPPYSGDGFNE